MRKHIADLSLVAGCVQEAISMYTAVVESLRSHNDWLWLGSAYEGLSCAAIVIKMKEQMLQGEFINGLNWKNSPKLHHRLLNAKISGRISPIIKNPAQENECSKSGELGASIEEPLNINEQDDIFEENSQNGYNDDDDVNNVDPPDEPESSTQRLLQKDFIVDKFTRALHYYGKVCDPLVHM